MLEIWQGDSLQLPLADDSVDLVFFSPPYEDAREYQELRFNRRGAAWVEWMLPYFREYARVCRGLIACVVDGRTRNYAWSGTPFLLWVELQRMGLSMRKPPVFYRNGIFGSGGKDWLKDNYEPVICCTRRPGRLPWSDNTAMGHPPKYRPGGRPSYRTKSGDRVKKSKPYTPPAKANPGNVIHCLVGGGHMGHPLAHGNEAPFPEALANFFIRSFCPPGGIVLDPMAGSGTTLAAAFKAGRRAIAIDVRESQCELMRHRAFCELGQSATYRLLPAISDPAERDSTGFGELLGTA